MEPEVPKPGYCQDIWRRKAIILDFFWTLSTMLKYGGLILALAGVALFGWHFVRANARAAARDTGTDAVAWGGPRAVLGAKVVAAGVAVQLAGFVLASLLPGRM